MQTKNKIYLIFSLLVILLLTGCISEQTLKPAKKEQLLASDLTDVDNDGTIDYGVYSYSPVSLGSGITSTRTLLVSSEPNIILTGENDLTDADVLEIDSYFSDFSRDYEDTVSSCLKNMGVRTVSCATPSNCLTLCNSNSVKCKNIAKDNPDVVSNFMLPFINDNNEIRELRNDINRDIPNLRTLSTSRKENFLSSIYKIIGKTSSLNSNPLIVQDDVKLCEPVSYDVSNLLAIVEKIGDHTVADTEYKYRVSLAVNFGNLEKNEQLKYSDVSIIENTAAGLEIFPDSLSASQPSTVDNPASSTILNWYGIRPASKPKATVFYSFNSGQEPSEISSLLAAPSVTIKTFNLSILTPVVILYDILRGVTNNFYISLGFSLSIMMVIIFLLMNLASILYNVIRSTAAKESSTTGIRRALGRTGVRWKSDIVAGIILLAIGFGSMVSVAPTLPKTPEFFASPEVFTADPLTLVPVLSLFFGLTLVYLAVENKIKVSALEGMYGKELKEDKDLFIERANQLKVRLKDLKELVAEVTKENFDVGQEYDVLSSISADKIDSYLNTSDNTSKKIVEDELAKVEESIERLHERKSQAEQNWERWKDAIYKIIDEGSEVHPNNLLTIPASLRSWALQRFLKEQPDMGLAFEGSVLKRKQVAPDSSVKHLVDSGVLIGAIVIKSGKVVISKIVKGNPTLIGLLSLKLFNYLKSAPRELGQHDFNTLASIGDKYVMVLLKQPTADSVLIMEKDKFKTAMDMWKEKVKNL